MIFRPQKRLYTGLIVHKRSSGHPEGVIIPVMLINIGAYHEDWWPPVIEIKARI